MDQQLSLDIDTLQRIVDCCRRNNRPLDIDFSNRKISVLSDVITDHSVILSDGPMQYQEYIGHITSDGTWQE